MESDVGAPGVRSRVGPVSLTEKRPPQAPGFSHADEVCFDSLKLVWHTAARPDARASEKPEPELPENRVRLFAGP